MSSDFKHIEKNKKGIDLAHEPITESALAQIKAVIDHFTKEFGCQCEMSNEFPSNSIYIALDVKLPIDREVFIPGTEKIRVFKVDPRTQIMTIIFYPDSI